MTHWTHRFLFVSADAALMPDLAWQVHRKGCEETSHIEAEANREVDHGFVPETEDVIVFDDIWVGQNVGTGKQAADLRDRGKAVVGGTPTPTVSRRTVATR